MRNRFYFLCFFTLLGLSALAQPTYYMSNQTVDDCKGFLLDSENGDISGNYDHNENYTFSICIPGSGDIVMEFQSFCTEEDFDIIRIYDGPDTLSNLIFGPHTGEAEPPQLIATSGCLTVNFISDPNVACTGWIAEWYVEVEEPVPPNILPIGLVPCESNTLTITFDELIPCDSIYEAAFSLLGPQIPPIISAVPNPCNGGMTSTVTLTFGAPLATSGNYQITYTSYEYDECGELYILRSVGDFIINDCPLFVVLASADDPVCEGNCTRLQADVTGGIAGSYTYQWGAPIVSDSSAADVCPLTETTYTLTVTDALGSSVVDSILVMVNPAPIIDNGDQSICQSLDTLFLTAIPPGGTWSGNGINEDNESTGWYLPDLVDVAQDTVTYTDPNGCSTQVFIDITPLDDGNDDAACPSSSPFQVSGGLPLGGAWSGPFIDASGLFTPPDTAGVFTVTYTHPNGCSGSKNINVDTISMPVIDTLCQSVASFLLPVTPFGGVWNGDGIVDEDRGEFDPAEAMIGSNILVYTINGCVDSLEIFIKAINAQFDFVACPEQSPFIVPGNWQPAGGIWNGLGIADSLTGLYDPSLLPNNANDTLTYSVEGCVGTRIAYIRQTEIQLPDTLEFCTGDAIFALDRENTGRRPNNGIWQGPGISNPQDDEWLFNPTTANSGFHTLFYTANTCTDSMSVYVFPRPVITPETFCEEKAATTLTSNPAGGFWEGNGIVNGDVGVFDPSVAGGGEHLVSVVSLDGCYGEATMTVIPFEEAMVEGLEAFYCYKDSVISLDFSPLGGTFTIDEVAVTSFNPAELGSGLHQLKYSVGQGACYSETTALFEVGFPIEVTLPFEQDTLCFGEGITLSAQGSGGINPSTYTYNWSNGLGFGRTQLVSPNGPTNYTVSVSDGCSDIATANIFIFVHPAISTAYTTGPRVCYDEETTARISASPGLDYTFTWNSEPPTEGPDIASYPTTYEVDVVNNETGCSVETSVRLPGYDPITANFGISPNEDCISSLSPEINVLDFSVGGVDGYWDFGDGSPRQFYRFGDNLSHTFPDTGIYTIVLHIENEGNCESEFELDVCVEPEYRLFAPNAFTPNIDGINDFFQFKGLGISEIDWQVFNRWGQVIYSGQSMEDAWDGEYKNRIVSPGVYTFLARYKTIYSDEEQILKGFVTVVY